MACAWTGVGTTNSFLARLFRSAEQRLSSEKCFIDYVQIFLAGCLAPGGAGGRTLRRTEARAGSACQAAILGNCSQFRKFAQASTVATFARAISDRHRCGPPTGKPER
jgi:hypothetical protein